ncbi:MAG: N-acetyltransferase family protein [Candidatus Woesearchaeota archaeon]
MEIIKAGVKDLETIYELNKKLAAEEAKHDIKVDPNVPKEEFMRSYSKKLVERMSSCFIAKNNDIPIGYVLGWIEESTYIYRYKAKGIIAECFVEKTYRKQRIGSKLIERLKAWFKENQVDWILVDVLANNNALEFWKKMGLREYSIRLSDK